MPIRHWVAHREGRASTEQQRKVLAYLYAVGGSASLYDLLSYTDLPDGDHAELLASLQKAGWMTERKHKGYVVFDITSEGRALFNKLGS